VTDPAAWLAAELDKLEATAHEVLPQRRWNAGLPVPRAEHLVMPDALAPDDERIWVLDDDYKHNTLVADERFVLDLVGAHRAILELHKPKMVDFSTGYDDPGWRQMCGNCYAGDQYWTASGVSDAWPCPTIQLLAQAFGWTCEEDRAER
jgi:hypothetical protein